MDDYPCVCGHTFDEHDEQEGLVCTVDDCDCCYFDIDESEALS